MNKSNTILKPYLRKFILQIHPDFFHNDKLKKETNAASLQKLYNVLQPPLSPPHSSTKTPIKLEFFTKKKKFKAIIELSLEDSEWQKTRSFFKLCQQVNIPILQSDLDKVNDMLSQQAPAVKKSYSKSLTREFAEKLYKQHNTERQKQALDANYILNHHLIMFDPDIKGKKIFATHLSNWLPQLKPEIWWEKIPAIILSPETKIPSSEETKGILILKSNMTLEDVKKSLERVIKDL